METTLIIVLLAATVGAGVRFVQTGRGRLAAPVTTIALALVTTAVSVVGNLDPYVLDALGRNRELLLAGQWWRLVTPLLVQDGGWAGTAFNLVALLVVGTFAEAINGGRALVAVYLVAGIVSEVVAYTLLQHQGFAGNSVAILGLAASCLVAFACLRRTLTQVFGIVGLIAGAALLVIGNLHGVGFAVGALAGALLAAFPNLRSRPTAD